MPGTAMGVWKTRKAESGIVAGTGIGTGLGKGAKGNRYNNRDVIYPNSI